MNSIQKDSYLYSFPVLAKLLMMLFFMTSKSATSTSSCFRYKNMAFKMSMSSTRESSKGISLDTNLMADNAKLVKSHLTSRRASQALLAEIDKIASFRDQRNALIVQGDAARSERKKASLVIGQLMKDKKDVEVAEMKLKVEEYGMTHSLTRTYSLPPKALALFPLLHPLAKTAASADEKLLVLNTQMEQIALLVPNLLDDAVPDGDDDGDNPIVFTWMEDKRKIGSNYKWHDDLATGVGGLNTEAAAKISGARFSILVGPIARLERALIQYFLDFHTSRGYTEVSVPYIVTRSTLQGTGQLPKFEDDLFKVSHDVAGEDAFLIPTAEVPVTNMYR